MNKGAETQGDVPVKPDVVGFESRPAPPNFFWDINGKWVMWAGLASTLLGALYLLQGAMLPGTGLVVLGALFVKAFNDA